MLFIGDVKVGVFVVSWSGNLCFLGDLYGVMKLWDLRIKVCVEIVYNEDGYKFIIFFFIFFGFYGNNIFF